MAIMVRKRFITSLLRFERHRESDRTPGA
jgi:hypothetical protein